MKGTHYCTSISSATLPKCYISFPANVNLSFSVRLIFMFLAHAAYLSTKMCNHKERVITYIEIRQNKQKWPWKRHLICLEAQKHICPKKPFVFVFEGVFVIVTKKKKRIKIHVCFLNSTTKIFIFIMTKKKLTSHSKVFHTQIPDFGSKGSISFGTDMHEKKKKINHVISESWFKQINQQPYNHHQSR